MLLARPAIHFAPRLSIQLSQQMEDNIMASDKLQIRLNPEQKRRLQAIAEARQVTVTDVIKDAIAELWFRFKNDQTAGADKPNGADT